MSDKPEELRLADELERVYGYPDTHAAAAELRRLHELNQELLDALLGALPFVEDAVDDVCFKPGWALKQLNAINAAIAKATGESA